MPQAPFWNFFSGFLFFDDIKKSGVSKLLPPAFAPEEDGKTNAEQSDENDGRRPPAPVDNLLGQLSPQNTDDETDK